MLSVENLQMTFLSKLSFLIYFWGKLCWCMYCVTVHNSYIFAMLYLFFHKFVISRSQSSLICVIILLESFYKYQYQSLLNAINSANKQLFRTSAYTNSGYTLNKINVSGVDFEYLKMVIVVRAHSLSLYIWCTDVKKQFHVF